MARRDFGRSNEKVIKKLNKIKTLADLKLTH